MEKKIIVVLIALISCVSLSAQQLPQLTLRAIDQSVFNPAANGIKPYSQLMLHHRSQWVGFDNAPSTQFITMNGSLNDNMGLGGIISNDITGPTRRLSASIAYNYKVKINDFKLSLGLAAGVMQYGIDGKKITLYSNNDLAVAEQVSMTAVRPNVDFGAWFYNDKFYAGISIMQLMSNKIKITREDIVAVVDLTNHFYITSGYMLDMNDDIRIQPSFLVCGTFGTPLLVDLNVKGEWKEKVIAGLGFRTNDAFVMMMGVKFKKCFTVAYSYDVVFSKLRKYNSGSHDIVLLFDLLPAETKTTTSIK